MNANGDEKYLTTLPNSGLKIGKVLSLDFESDIEEWLLCDKEHLAIPSHEKFKVRPCNHIFKWIVNGKLYSAIGIAVNNTKYTAGIKYESTSGITEVSAMYGGIIASTEDTKTITLGQRFLIDGNAWRVTLIDNITKVGLISLSLGKDSVSSSDDTTNEIADANLHKYAITLNSTSESIPETSTYQISSVITDNNITVSNPTVTYRSSDETIATVNSNGLITALKVGDCTITISIGTVSQILSISVTEKTTSTTSYSYTWSNGTSLKTYMSSTMALTKTVDSVTTSLTTSYTLDSIGTSLINAGSITITEKTDSSYQIKNINVSIAKSFVITFIDNADSTVIITQTVSLSGM